MKNSEELLLTGNYIKQNLNSGIFVARSKEQEFCKKNNLILKRLKSGSTILGYQAKNLESNKSYVDVFFNRGSFYDPKDKPGLHQLFSINLLSTKIVELFDKDLVESSVTCDLFSTKIAFSSFYNNTNDFGIGNVLNSFIENLQNIKFSSIKTLDESKRIIISKIIADNSDFAFGIWDAVDNVIFKKDSFYLQGIYGSPDSLLNIKNKDLNLLKKEVIQPENTTYFIESNGVTTNNEKIVTKLTKILNNNDKTSSNKTFPKNFLTQNDFAILKDNFISRVNLQIKNSVCFYSTCFEIDTSKNDFISYIVELIKTSVFPKIFEKALQYYGLDLKNGVLVKKYLGGKTFLHFYFVAFSKNEDYYLKTLKKCINRTIQHIKNNEAEVMELVNKYKQNINLRPKTGANNFILSKNSLFSFDYLTNSEILDEYYLKITYKNILDFIDNSMNKKISFIVGDLE